MPADKTERETEVFTSLEWQIEQGIRQIIELANKTILINDTARNKKVEDAIRGIIKASAEAEASRRNLSERIDEIENGILPTLLGSGEPESIKRIWTRLEELKAKRKSLTKEGGD